MFIFNFSCKVIDKNFDVAILLMKTGLPWYVEVHMEFTSCPRILHGQPSGSTEIQTHDLHIQCLKC